MSRLRNLQKSASRPIPAVSYGSLLCYMTAVFLAGVWIALFKVVEAESGFFSARTLLTLPWIGTSFFLVFSGSIFQVKEEKA